jgi:hypothetical protein
VQLRSREEPKTKPQPLETLQVNIPAFTPLPPCADAGAGSAIATATMAAAASTERNSLSMLVLLDFAFTRMFPRLGV